MKDFFEELKKAKQAVHFDADRKAAVRNVLAHHINTEAARVMLSDRHTIQQRPIAEFLKIVLIKKPMPIIIALAIMFSGGAAFAAEQSLPGDVLYSVKVNINEPVAAAFQASAEAKANWDIRRAERRLEEAAVLTATRKMDAGVHAQLEDRFAAQAERVEKRIADFESRGDTRTAVDIASKFEGSLNAHDAILLRLGSKDSAAAESVRPIESRVKKNLQAISETRHSLEAKVHEEDGDDPQIEAIARAKVQVAENIVTSAQKYVEHERERLGVSATADAEAKLTTANGLLTDARAKLEAKAYADAFNMANRASRTAQEARLLAGAMLNADLKIGFGTDKEHGMRDDEDEAEASTTERVSSSPRSTSSSKEDEDSESEIKASSSIESRGGEIHMDGQGDIRIGL